MNYWTTFKLALAVILLGAAVWTIEKIILAPDPVRQRPYQGLKTDDIDYIACHNSGMKIELSKKSSGWFIEYPVRAAADHSVLVKLLSILEQMEAGSIISEEQRSARQLALGDYGLESPLIRITTGSRYFVKELLIGNPAPLGEAVYVKFADEQEVYSVNDIISNAVPSSVKEFRDSRILPGDRAKTARLEIHQRDGFVQLLRRPDGRWWIQQPFLAQADSALVDSVLDRLFSLKAERYVWDPPVQRDVEESVRGEALQDVYGFSEDVSPARIAVWAEGDEIGREIIFGKTIPDDANLIYVRRRSFESIFAVGVDPVLVSSIKATDLRNRLVYTLEPAEIREVVFEQGDARIILHRYQEDGWMITEPVRWRADDDYVNRTVSYLTRLQVSGFGAAGPLSVENLAELRLSPPAFRIGLAVSPCQQNPWKVAEADRKNLRECGDSMVSYGRSDTNNMINILFPDGQSASMDMAPLDAVNIKGITDPLRYRERNVLSLPSSGIRRIDLESAGVRESVALSGNGAWVSSSHTNRSVNANVINDILLIASNLRAQSFESFSPKSLSGYGLDRPAVSLTIGLSGDAGIHKTIMLGFKAGVQGIYGLIQGQDLILVLDRQTAELLSRSLLVPLVQPAGAESGVTNGQGKSQ